MPDDARLPSASEILAQLYRVHKTRLHRLVSRRLNDSCSAEDVTHEAFARMAAITDLPAIDNPLAMLTRIAGNIIRDGFRSERYRESQLRQLVHAPATTHFGPDPESSASHRQELARLRDAIDNLPPRCREVFVLHKIHGKTHSEVAHALGISRNMVEKHVIRAYTQLRQHRDAARDGDAPKDA